MRKMFIKKGLPEKPPFEMEMYNMRGEMSYLTIY